MTALAADRQFSTKEIFYTSSLPVKGATTIFLGAQVCLGATGFAIPAADAAAMVGPKVMGIALDHVDNSTGADGAKRVRVIHGVVSAVNEPTDLAGVTEVGKNLFVKDDGTVRKGTGTNSVVAGELAEIDSEGQIWVKYP